VRTHACVFQWERDARRDRERSRERKREERASERDHRTRQNVDISDYLALKGKRRRAGRQGERSAVVTRGREAHARARANAPPRNGCNWRKKMARPVPRIICEPQILMSARPAVEIERRCRNAARHDEGRERAERERKGDTEGKGNTLYFI